MTEKPHAFTPLLQVHKELLNLIFPARCIGCGVRGGWLCARCRNAAPRVPGAICKKCGCPSTRLDTCSDCWKTNPKFDAVRAQYFFDGIVRKAIHQFKYRGARHLSESLAQLLLESVEPDFLESDAIVPVPLHQRRLRERSYNQSQLLALEVSKALGIGVVDGCLVRRRDTEPQMRLPAEVRVNNVHAAFACVDRSLLGKKVLLVDDVTTTGATLNECAAALKRAGATRVWAICVARTQ